MGSHLISLLDNARKQKKAMEDDYLSVEHLLLAFLLDKRFGQQLLKNLQLGEKELKEAVLAVRGNQRVTDQSMLISKLTVIFFLWWKVKAIVKLNPQIATQIAFIQIVAI